MEYCSFAGKSKANLALAQRLLVAKGRSHTMVATAELASVGYSAWRGEGKRWRSALGRNAATPGPWAWNSGNWL